MRFEESDFEMQEFLSCLLKPDSSVRKHLAHPLCQFHRMAQHVRDA